MFKLQPGDTFSGEKLTETTKAITDALGAIGYAFASASPVPQIDRQKREVSFSINVDPGRRAYVRRVIISGNQRTRDEVVRREIRQFEGAWFDSERIKLSRDRIERLGYFQGVTINTDPVPGTPDQVDLRVNVIERQTGSFTFGVGFSSTEKFLISAEINEPNFLGTGNTMSVALNTGETQRTAAVSFIQPYYTPNGISRTVDVYQRTFNARNLGLGDYRLRSSGIGLRFGIPYTELDRVSLGVTYEQNNIIPGGSLLPQRYVDHIAEYGQVSGAFLAVVGWTRDSRDSALSPTRGRLQRLNVETTFPGQELQYTKATYAHHWFIPVTKDYTLALNADVGYGRSLGDKAYPVFKNFYAGGINSVRGFSPNSLGPKDPNDNLPIGGTAHFGASAEFLFPLPGTGNDKTIRTFFFLDGGNVFENAIDLADLRYSFGMGINWLSPIGPLKLSLGYPLRKEPGDDTQRVQFQIGTGF